MFARVLYQDRELTLELDWFGLGRLKARHRLGGVRAAHPLQKRCFLHVIQAFANEGEPVSPSNPKCMVLMRDIAELLMHHPPSGIGWKILLDDPEGAGMRYAK